MNPKDIETLLSEALSELAGRSAAADAGANADLLGAFIASRTSVTVVNGAVSVVVVDDEGNVTTPTAFAASLRANPAYVAMFRDAPKLPRRRSRMAGWILPRSTYEKLSPKLKRRVIAEGIRLFDS